MMVTENGVEREATAEELAEIEAAQAALGSVETSPIVVYPADLWRRATDTEAQMIMESMDTQPLRIRKIFDTARTYQSTNELWPLLIAAAEALFGVDRAAELLAPSV